MATEFVGIELQLLGADGVKRALQDITQLANSLGGRKKVDMGLKEINRQLLEAQGNLRKYQKDMREATKGSEEWKTAKANVQATKDEIAELDATAKIARTTLREMGKTFQQTFQSIQSRVAHIGSAMQSLGNSLTRLTSPFSRITTGLLYGAGYKALNMITSGFSGAFERYDTMQNYAKSLNALGLNADQTFKVFKNQKEAMTAIDNLNESVLGLPTGLDEIVAAQKVYAGATGEMVKSTKTAIAANNTFLASGMDSHGQIFMQKYLVALASGAELTTNQWQSMARIAPLAMRAVSEELGYASKDYQEFISELHAGTIAGDEFLEAFIKVGTDGRVQAAANVMKTTWSGLAANITNATKRMGEGILKALDDAFVSYNGRNFVQNLLGFDAEGNEIGGGIKHWINDISSSVQDWIRANPQVIMDFFNDLKKIDVKGLLKGIALGLGDIAKIFKSFAGSMEGRGLENFGRMMIRLNMAGTALLVMGGIIKGLRGPIAFIGTLGTKLGVGGIFGKIVSLFGSLAGINKAKKVADKIPSATSSMRRAVKNLSGAISFFGTIALGAGTGFVAFRSMREMVRDFKAIADELNTMTPEQVSRATDVLSLMAIFYSTFAVVADAIGGAVGSLSAIAETPAIIGGLVTSIMSAMIAFNFKAVEWSFKSFFKMTDYLIKAKENMAKLRDIKVSKKAVDEALQLMTDISGVFAQDYQTKKDGGMSTLNEVASKKYKQIITNISQTVEAIKKTIEDLANLPELSTEDIDKATSKINDGIAAMKSIYDELMKEIDLETDIQKGSEKWQRSKNEGVVKAVADIIKTIKNSLADFKALETLDVELETAKQNILKVGNKMSEINDAFLFLFGEQKTNTYQMGEEMGGGSASVTYNTGATEDMVEKATNLKDMFDAFSQTISYVREAYQSIMGKEGEMKLDPEKLKKTMDGLTGENGVLPQMKGMFDKLAEDFGGEEVDFETPMDNFVNAVQKVKDAIIKFNEIQAEIGKLSTDKGGGFNVVSKIKGIITQLTNAFSADAVSGLKTQIDAFAQSIKDALQAIADMDEEYEVKATVTLNKGFGESVKGVKETINEARKSILKLNKAIVLRIPVRVSFVVSTNFGSALSRILGKKQSLSNAGGRANGGMIYRAGGGGVPNFKRRGTDTVPAMLTPGEYVHNKRAVNMFGIDFMRKVNNLDMRGAMNELLAKAGHMANVGRQTVVHNTYNNNSNVTINNGGGAGAGFTYKSASRFAGAL